MENIYNTNINGIIILIFLIMTFFLLYSLIAYIKIERDKNYTSYKNAELKYNSDRSRINYTISLMKFLKDFSGEITIMKFHEFRDKVDFTKVNEEKIKRLIEDIATTINSSINWHNISIEESLLNEEFYNTYIVNNTIIIVKELTSKVIDAINR
jgi:hypothetical protein